MGHPLFRGSHLFSDPHVFWLREIRKEDWNLVA
jgi:hypothetical protein